MGALREISFTLNGAPVIASVAPHHNLVELLPRGIMNPGKGVA